MGRDTMLNGKRRNAMEITISVLEEARNGINKTRLVYRTNLNFLLIQRYTDFLQQKGLIEFVSEPQPVYKTTQKGIELLDEFSKIKQILGVNDLSVDEVSG
jgi:predicted transcriptional regulator